PGGAERHEQAGRRRQGRQQGGRGRVAEKAAADQVAPGWTPLGGALRSGAAAAFWGAVGEIEVFAIQNDGQPAASPPDADRIKGYKAAGTVPVRGSAKIGAPGKVVVRTDDGARELEARDIIIAVGSIGKVPKLEGLAEAGFWTNKEGTSLRDLPKSIAVLGAGPSGTELAQVYARFGVRTTLVSPRQVNPSDHPRSS